MGGFAKVLPISLQPTLGRERHTFSRLWERRPFLVAPAGIGSVLNQAVSFLWSPVCVHNKSSFPPIGFCLNGCL